MSDASVLGHYGYSQSAVSHTHSCRYPSVDHMVKAHAPGRKLFEIGWGNGSMPAVMAASGKMESHFTALWEGGHIKFWSRSTLGTLFSRVGMREIAFDRVGRIPALAKSMVVTYRKRGG